jgi:integrase
MALGRKPESRDEDGNEMAIRALNKLTSRQVETLGDGVHSDGGNLLLYVHSDGAGRSWIFRYVSPATGKVREMGLGRAGANAVTLAAARTKRDEYRGMIDQGLDPLAERQRRRDEQAGKRTFLEVAKLTLDRKVSGWRGGKDGSSFAQWTRTIDKETKPLHALPIDAITVAEIKLVVAPMWDEGHHETARMTLARVAMAFDFAVAHGWASSNPASWSIFKHIAPDGPDVKPHPALPWEQMPEFITRLRQSKGMPALALEFVVLTAARLSEVRLAEFSEIDFDKAVWNIPAARMKRGIEHAVPLSSRALAIVTELRALRPKGRYIFPSHDGSPMGRAAIWATACRMTDDRATVHGFRSSWRSWAADHGMPFDLAESALAHSRGAVVEAYMRTSMIERRRSWMQMWDDFLAGKAAANVIELHAHHA